MNVQEILETVAFKYPHSYANGDIIKIINRVQKELFRRLFKPESAAQCDIIADNPFYPIDFPPQNIIEVVVNGVEYKPKTVADRASRRFYYVEDNNTLGIFPTPTEDAVSGLVIFRYMEPTELTTSDLGTEPDFDSAWHMLIVYRVCKELAENAMDSDMGNYFIGQINSLEDEYRSSTHIAPSEIQLPDRWCV